jgi:hypothetical protein
MASSEDDQRSTTDPTSTDPTAAAKGGYGERSLPDDVSAEDARRHAARLEAAESGPVDTQGMTRTDVPHSSAQAPEGEAPTEKG